MKRLCGFAVSYIVTYALLCHLAPTSVVCLSLSVVTLVSPAKTAETIKLPFAVGLGWAQWTMYYMRYRCQHGKEQFWGGNRQTSIGTLCGHLCKYGWTDRGAVWVAGSHGPKASGYMAGLDPPWERAILVDRRAHCKVQALSAVRCAKTAERINLPFRMWTRVGRRIHKFSRICQVAPMCPHGRTRCRHLLITLNHPFTAAMRLGLTTCYLWTRPLVQSHR